ncbi:GAF and ANTAR domain-containing protein [Streptomyces sp. NPDC049915]|uniref:GAF and ANTAR domain-containing protein n=1 Tax=Streptomyces sp. NPDC049915 TaxID=3155510 RepID=UPI0034383BD3
MAVAGDGAFEDDDYERQTDARRARVARELIVGVRGLPPAEVPDALCRACMTLLPWVSGVSVSVCGRDTDTGVVLCASDAVATRIAEIQYTLGEGPCTEAVRLRAPVFATDLTRAPDARRWPLFSDQAAKAGAQAAFSLPLTVADTPLGTLDLYRRVTGSLSEDQASWALLVADAVTLAVIALDRASAETNGVVTWLEGAQADREEVHQATGMIMVQLGVGADEAVLLLRARAFAQGRTTTEIARAIIARTMDIRND